jgi:secondary thiamine-phosphate synthase enzyme
MLQDRSAADLGDLAAVQIAGSLVVLINDGKSVLVLPFFGSGLDSSPMTQTMKAHQEVLDVPTRGRGFVDLSGEVQAVVEASGVKTGLCTVFVQHTSASLVIQENADPSVQRDLQKWMSRIAPEDEDAYEHDAEGVDDMPSHLRSTITRTSEVVPVTKGRLALGTWQAIYLWEHRRGPHTRSVIVHVQGV